jgi:hypothetical protein
MRRVTVALLAVALVILAAVPAWAASKDRRPPRVGFTTQDQDVVVAAPSHSAATAVQGWAKDKGSGIRRVTVTYCPGRKSSDGSWTCNSTGTLASPSRARATLACDPPRRSCTWEAPVPRPAGSYLAFVKAVDRAGNARERGPIQIYVI